MDQEMASEDDEVSEGGSDKERDESDDEVGLNNESVPAEPDEEFSQESKSEHDLEDEAKEDDVSEVDSKMEEKDEQDLDQEGSE
jgi:hypothetical protein